MNWLGYRCLSPLCGVVAMPRVGLKADCSWSLCGQMLERPGCWEKYYDDSVKKTERRNVRLNILLTCSKNGYIKGKKGGPPTDNITLD